MDQEEAFQAFQGVASLGVVLLAEVEALPEAAHQVVGVQQAAEGTN